MINKSTSADTKGLTNTGDFFKQSQVEDNETEGMVKYAVDVEESKKLKNNNYNGGLHKCQK